MSAIKQAYLLREHVGPDVEINICYNDIRAFGRGYEDFYRRVRGMNTNLIHGLPSEVRAMDNGQLDFDVFDSRTKKYFEVTSDLIILVPALVPRVDSEEMARLLRISQSTDGFFLEAHPKLRPMDTSTGGIFLAGCCQGPKDIPDTVSQASGAASRAATIISHDEYIAEPIIAYVNESLCSGCGLCISACSYSAIELVDEKARVNTALCEGCGLCSATCRPGAIQQKGFNDHQIISMIKSSIWDVY